MQKLTSVELIAKVNGESREQVRRYIRLTYLIPELLKLVDDTVIHDKRTYLTLGLTTAVELSYLNKGEQKLLFASIEYEDLTPNRDQAIRIRKLSQKHKLDFNSLEKILDEKKGIRNMKRIINFTKEENQYIFKEENKDNKIEIEEDEKTLNGLELYNQFFNVYSVENSFEIVDCTTEEDKKDDKICYPIYKKVIELFSSIEEAMKLQLSSKEKNE